ncbi:iron ABC transporter permease [Treponema sp.]
MSRKAYVSVLTLLCISFFIVLLLGLSAGAVTIPAREILDSFLSALKGTIEGTNATILWELRLPRALLASSVGAALAVSGTGFQGFFRNPLADPYVIGASSGAALGAALALVSGLPNFGPLSAAAVAAFIGALIATALAFMVSRAAGDPPPAAALLLAGTALSSLFSAALSLVLVLKDRDMHRVCYWLLGGFGGATWSEFISLAPVMALGCLLVFIGSRPLDLLASGEDAAESLGLDVRRARLIVAAGASLAAAAAVAAAGIVGFVGLVAPHAVRFVSGPSHKRLLPGAALGGALLVLLADLISRVAAAPLELPIGVVTSAVGAPFFLWILAHRGRSLGNLR